MNNKFLATIGTGGMVQTQFQLTNVLKIQKIQNPTLYQQYMYERQRMEERHKTNPDVKCIERELWHGANQESMDIISARGFDKGKADKTDYGLGTYFAVYSSYPASDKDSTPPDSDNLKRIFLTKVLTGYTKQVEQGKYKEKYPPVVIGGSGERYDSTCDNQDHPTWLVIYNDTRAYPEYLVLFE